jgi:hypothetical protein
MTRAILRLRASAEFTCTGVVGVGGTSIEEERVKRGVACTRDGERGTVSRKIRGRGVRRDRVATTNDTFDSSVESDVLSSDSLEDEAPWENVGSGKLSMLGRDSAKPEH